ncbi:MAG TPA: thiol:disulfide interchange protein DsbA/DsbL [Usitatibacter sp.]|jgi:thiol:disulfide interchange protein DsbA|nr:thiol:disulfide interchange protein DsbA/DsbL [Usitatibacter sp.]
MSLRKALTPFLMMLASVFAANASAADYALVAPPQPTESGGKIEVIEFFWYGCPHCYHLEPMVNAWLQKKPDDVVFKRVPAYPSESWGDLARVFYTVQAMGLLPQLHDKIFDAIHKERVNLGNKKIREQWLAQHGVDPAKYEQMEKSFTVVSDMARAKQMTINYKVDSVPRLVVNGKYYTSGELAGSPERIFAVVDELVAKVRAENGKGGKR